VENVVALEPLGPLALKGFARPVPAFRVVGQKSA
jgi:class 3 adenylate cyclase